MYRTLKLYSLYNSCCALCRRHLRAAISQRTARRKCVPGMSGVSLGVAATAGTIEPTHSSFKRYAIFLTLYFCFVYIIARLILPSS
jgi:hypothetical protein